MPESYKRLGAIAPADDKEYLLYVTPDATESLISNITVTNRSATATSFDINVYRPPYTEYTPTGTTVRLEVGLDNLIEIRDTYDFAVGGNGLGFYYSGTIPQSHIDAILSVQAGDTITTFDGTNTYTFTATGAGQYSGMGSDYVIPGGTGEAGYMQTAGNYADIAGQTATTYGVTQQSDLDDVVNLAPTYVAVAGGYGNSQTAATSTDGITWAQRTLPVSTGWTSITYGNDTFVAVAVYTSTAATSTDSITWTQGTLPVSDGWRSVTYGNGTFVAVAQNSQTSASSTDGITWTQGTLPAPWNWRSVTYGNNTFVAVASATQAAATSTDGITWTQRTLPVGAFWQSVTYGNGTFVAVATYNSDAAASSTDGITWTQGTLPVSAGWFSVTYGNGTFVAVAYNSQTAATSTDGITWTQRTLPVSAGWTAVTYGNGTFVAVAVYTSTAASSTDGITWTQGTLPVSDFWEAVTYGEDIQPYSSPSLNNLYKTSEIGANETLILEPGIALSASASIVAKDNSGGNLTISTYGVELS